MDNYFSYQFCLHSFYLIIGSGQLTIIGLNFLQGVDFLTDNIIVDKSKKFAVRIVNLYKHLCDTKREFVLSKQILRSGTSIGANIHEGIQAQSRNDFISKMNIALKEASETEYWLDLLHETDYISHDEYRSIADDCSEINKILIAILKTSKKK